MFALQVISTLFLIVVTVCFVRINKQKNQWQGIPRIKRASWLAGNRTVKADSEREAEPEALLRQYTEEYGPTFVYPDVLGRDVLYTIDTAAISFVLSDTDTFVRDETTIAFIEFLTGGGLVAAFGQAHKRMRRAVSPSFSIAQLRKASQIIAQTAALLSKRMGQSADVSERDIDCCPLLDSAALDAIAEAGFGYKTNALRDGIESSLLARTYATTVHSALGGTLSLLLMMGLGKIFSPRMVSLPLTHSNRTIIKQKSVINQIASDIVKSKKGSLEGLDKESINDELHGEKDILSSIVRNNLTSPAHSTLSDEELLGQIQTFLFAGFETTASTFAWCLWHLAKDNDVQERIRKEVQDFFAQEDISSVADMTYEQIWDERLGSIARTINETLRMHPPVAHIDRVAKKPAVIPREDASSFVVNKGDTIMLGLSSLNFQSKYYGDKVHTFNPDRWLSLPEAHKSAALSSYGFMSFSVGPKACIGSKFALTEMRCFLIELINNFQFEKIVMRQALVYRSTVIKDNGDLVSAMPIRVQRLNRL